MLARSDISAKRAADRIEYAETAARYEYMNLVNHEQGEGLSVEEVRAIARERLGTVKPAQVLVPKTARKKPKHKKPIDVEGSAEE